LFLLTFAICFYTEGLLRKPMLPAFVLIGILGVAVLLPLTQHLPLSVQRTISFLPLPIDPVAKASAEASTEWRLTMWKHVLPQVPQYLLLGKGYAIVPGDLEMVRAGTALEGGTYGAELAGDYHNGPLSLIIPFGIFGAVAFLWFLVAGVKVLLQNYQNGDPTCRAINRFLLSYFIAKIFFFFGVFGGFFADLAGFTGLVGLSICVNGGVLKPALAPQPRFAYDRFRLPPGVRRPLRV